MNKYPLDERLLFVSLPGFNELSEEEKGRLHVISFEYKNHPEMFSCDLFFQYLDLKGRKISLKFEMTGCREDDHFFRHIIYEDYCEELEFPSFREAVDHFEGA